MFDAFEGFFDTPPTMIKVGKCRCGEGGDIEQGGHQDIVAAVGRDDANETHRGALAATFEVSAIAAARGADGDDLFGTSGALEGFDTAVTGVVGAHTKMLAALAERRDEPVAGIAAVEHQVIVRAQILEVFEQHLPFSHGRRIELKRQAHFQARQVEGESDGLPNLSLGGVTKEQAQFRGVACDDTETVPAGDRETRLDQLQKTLVQKRENDEGKLPAGFGNGLRGYCA